jgi:PAS domain S-box-containing protein
MQGLFESILDVLESHIAVLDAEGTIIAANRAWRQFAAHNDGVETRCSVGANYLTVCDNAALGGAEEAPSVAQALREVISGQRELFTLEYPCHSPTQQRWFFLRATPLANADAGRAVVIHANITRRKMAEAEQQAKAREVLTIWESMTDAFYALDTDWHFTYVNAQAALLLQKSREELIGKCLWDEFPEIVGSTFEREYRRALEQKVTARFEEFYPPLNGWYEVHVHPSAAGLAVYFRDITERRQMVEALRTSEERSELLNRATNDAVYDWDIATGDLWWNDNLESLFGHRKAEFEPTIDYWESKIHPDDRQRVSNSLSAVMDEDEQSWTQEYRFQRADGSYATVFDRGFIIRDAESKPARMVGSVQDITARKEAEEERDRFFTLSLDMLCIADMNGYFKRVNPAFEATLGHSTDEMISNPYLKWVHPDDLEATLAEMQKLDQGENTLSFINRYRCADGSYKWLSWRSAPFQGLIYAAAHDITLLKRAEAALHKANDELERRVMERTAELSTAIEQLGAVNEALRVENIQHQMTMTTLREVADALQVAKEEADRANDAKSEFLSRMSHELRTPLNAILGFGQLLEMESLNSYGQESVHHILKAGEHLLGLINEVLDIARVDTGSMHLSIEPVALNEVIDECCSLLRPLAAERQIYVSHDTERWQGVYVLADHQRFKQVLINLLSNAIKYNRIKGQVTVTCQRSARYSAEESAGTQAESPVSPMAPTGATTRSTILIKVQDTGIGIAPDQLPKLFTPFERLGAEESEVEGVGLGLALTKRLVEAMNGALHVESEPGKGSLFTIELPETLGVEGVLGEIPEETKDASAVAFETVCTVLCIEDNLSNLRLIERILTGRPDITLMAAMQGSVGLDLAHQHQPDLILLDLNLPDLSGIEVFVRLQQAEATRDIPVIVLSADATPTQKERLLLAGVRAYLTKPLNVREFLQTIDALLG